jgi:hypothetical protein
LGAAAHHQSRPAPASPLSLGTSRATNQLSADSIVGLLPPPSKSNRSACCPRSECHERTHHGSSCDHRRACDVCDRPGRQTWRRRTMAAWKSAMRLRAAHRFRCGCRYSSYDGDCGCQRKLRGRRACATLGVDRYSQDTSTLEPLNEDLR